VAMEPPHMTWI